MPNRIKLMAAGAVAAALLAILFAASELPGAMVVAVVAAAFLGLCSFDEYKNWKDKS